MQVDLILGVVFVRVAPGCSYPNEEAIVDNFCTDFQPAITLINGTQEAFSNSLDLTRGRLCIPMSKGTGILDTAGQ